MQRGLIALVAALAVGLGAASPALAASPHGVTGTATSVTSDSADLNGIAYHDHVGTRWLFEYSTRADFDAPVLATVPVAVHGGLTVVEHKVSGLSPATTYYWRIVLVVRTGNSTARSFGQTRSLRTAAAAASTPSTDAAASS